MLPNEQLDVLLGALRRSGYRVTQARRAVIVVLAQAAGHMTAPDLVKAVRTRETCVGRASVYRTLFLLMQLGLVQSSTLGGPARDWALSSRGIWLNYMGVVPIVWFDLLVSALVFYPRAYSDPGPGA